MFVGVCEGFMHHTCTQCVAGRCIRVIAWLISVGAAMERGGDLCSSMGAPVVGGCIMRMLLKHPSLIASAVHRNKCKQKVSLIFLQ